VEVVNVRVRGARGRKAPPPVAMAARASAAGGPRSCKIWWKGRRIRALRVGRAGLAPGERIEGPCVVTDYSATTFLPPGWRVQVDSGMNLLLTRKG